MLSTIQREAIIHRLTEKVAKKKDVRILSKKGMRGLGKNALKLGVVGGSLALGAKALTAAEEAVTSPMEKALGKAKMLKANPDLKKHDKKTVDRFYNTVYKFSPKTATDPMAAGATMRRFLTYKDVGPQAQDIKGLADVEKSVRQSKGTRISDALSPSALSALSGIG